MKEITVLPVIQRTKATKGTMSALRKSGQVPAVIYGDKQTPTLIAIENKVLVRQMETAGFMTRLFDLELDGKKFRALPRDVQYDPLTDRPLHIDFLRVSANTRVRVAIPVSFVNADKSPGIKRGGTLNIVHHAIEVLCAPDKIPAHFEVSLEGLQINDAVHLSALSLPEGVTLTTREKDFTIATIAVPSAIRSEAEEAAAAAAAAALAPAAPLVAEGAAAAPAGAPGAAAPAAAGGAAAPAAGAAAPAAGAAAKKPEAKKPEGKK